MSDIVTGWRARWNARISHTVDASCWTVGQARLRTHILDQDNYRGHSLVESGCLIFQSLLSIAPQYGEYFHNYILKNNSKGRYIDPNGLPHVY